MNLRKTLWIGFSLLLLSACGVVDNKSVTAKQPTPPSIETQARSLLRASSNSSVVTQSQGDSYMGDLSVILASRAQIQGLNVFVQPEAGDQVSIDVEMVQALSSGCFTSAHFSQTVSDQQLYSWVPVDAGEMFVRCIDGDCEFLLFYLDRYTGGDPADPYFRHVRAQAGGVVLKRDEYEPTRYLPTASRDQNMFLNADGFWDAQFVCSHANRSFDTEVSDPSLGILPGNPGNGSGYNYFPDNNSPF